MLFLLFQDTRDAAISSVLILVTTMGLLKMVIFEIAFFRVMVPCGVLAPFIADVYKVGENEGYAFFGIPFLYDCYCGLIRSGFLNVAEPLPLYTTFHFLAFPALIYPYIFFTRRTVSICSISIFQ